MEVSLLSCVCYMDLNVSVHGVADVDLLFDDGVEYTAPVVNVRKRVSLKHWNF